MEKEPATKPAPARLPPDRRAERRFMRQAILFYSVGLMFALVIGLLWFATDVLLLLFSCILVAVLLHELASRLHRRLRLPMLVSLFIVVILLLGSVVLGAWLLAPQIGKQAGDLLNLVPQAINSLRKEAMRYPILGQLLSTLPPTEQLMSRSLELMSHGGSLFSGFLGALGNTVVILFIGVYLAAQPGIYIRGLLLMTPHHNRGRIREVITEMRRTLGQWLLGKAITMLLVGVATSVGLVMLDVPLGLALGILAGVLDFIPYLGPVLAGVPAVLIAFAESTTLGLYVILLFVGVQVLEGYILSPLIERRTVSLPPALTIVMQVLFGALFGLGGVALATPLTAVFAVLVTMLYVQDVLGDPVKTPSEQ
jgi:predicted PurR-regulated permease PerM